MAKKSGIVYMALFVIVFSAVNLYLYFNEDSASYAGVSGMFTADLGLPFGITLSTVAFVLQWIVLLAIVLFAYAKFLKHRKEEEMIIQDGDLKRNKTRSETDLDVLYDLLKKKKNLSTGAIAKAFNITKDNALEWGKILEDHELTTVEYPAFNDPEVRINEKEETDTETKEETSPAKKEEPKNNENISEAS